MKRALTLTALTLSLTATALQAAGPQMASTGDRGRYLVGIMGCNDCHTPFKMGPHGPEPDMARFLSGHPAGMVLQSPKISGEGWVWAGAATNTAFFGPWGITYAPNLTSDATGIGPWTEENFLKAMKTGKHLGVGRPILPPMPWQAYSRATDEDLKAVFAFLKAVPAIKNQAPEAQMAPPPGAPAAAAPAKKK